MIGSLLVEPHGLRHYLRSHFLDPTFKGLYHANAFDMALLIPYFVVLVLLAFYGMHRYQLVYLYYKYRKNKVTDPASHFAELPRVTIQLPIFNEQFVIDRLIEASAIWSIRATARDSGAGRFDGRDRGRLLRKLSSAIAGRIGPQPIVLYPSRQIGMATRRARSMTACRRPGANMSPSSTRISCRLPTG